MWREQERRNKGIDRDSCGVTITAVAFVAFSVLGLRPTLGVVPTPHTHTYVFEYILLYIYYD